MQLGCTARSAGPHRLNATFPAQLAAPVTVTVAWSWTSTEPVPMEIEAFVISVPLESCGWVVVAEPQAPKLPSTKLFKTALVEVEARDSASVLAKHSPASPGNAERLMPPSKNSPCAKQPPSAGGPWGVQFVVPLLSLNDHGAVIGVVLLLVIPQNAAVAGAVVQLAAVDVPSRRRLESAQSPLGLFVAVQPVSHL